jgi:hypothetical protein
MDIAQKPPCRLAFVFAARAFVAVILRRGPARRVKMVLWHTNTDDFDEGEWWHGRIYEDKCGLSPDGRLFVYFGYQGKPRYVPEGFFAFSAVSRPPSFRPLALWPAGSTWGGGGWFRENRKLRLNYRADSLPKPHPSFHPHGLEIVGVPTDCSEIDPSKTFHLNSADYPGAEWVGKDHKGRVVFTRSGILYRLIRNQEIVVRDFNPDEPPPIPFH